MGDVAEHFQPESLKFLRGLALHNDREWFEARRGIYEQHIKMPMLALVEQVNSALLDIAPDHVRSPAKTMMRIYRDTRFSNDKRPYKKHVSAWFGRRSAVRTTGPGFYLHISPAEVQFGAGMFMPLPEQLIAVRQWIAENHLRYTALVKKLTVPRKEQPALELANPNPLARMPKGFAADHPAGELLRARRWGVLHTASSDDALQPDFAALIIGLIRAAAPLVLALDEAVGGGITDTSKRLKSMF